jgi:ATP-dependent Clp protease ATP-binding subunit ClpA
MGNAPPERRELPYDENGLALLRRAVAEARSSGILQVNTGHLLLAALTDPEGPAYETLEGAGVDVMNLADAARADLDGDELS